MRKLSRQSDPSAATSPFAALSEADRCVLQSWIPAAREAGIDDVRDLAARRWPVALSGAVIGMFTRGDDYAVWLAIEQGGQWVVAGCIDGSVSPPVDRLEDALAIIFHACDASEWA
jgi:hypothetical protein